NYRAAARHGDVFHLAERLEVIRAAADNGVRLLPPAVQSVALILGDNQAPFAIRTTLGIERESRTDFVTRGGRFPTRGRLTVIGGIDPLLRLSSGLKRCLGG